MDPAQTMTWSTAQSATIFNDRLFACIRCLSGENRTYEYKVESGGLRPKLTCVLSFINHRRRDGKFKSIVVHNGRKMILMGGDDGKNPVAWLLCDGTELGLSLPLPHASISLLESCVTQNDEHMARFLCIFFTHHDWKRWYYILSIPSEGTGEHSWQPCISPVDQRRPLHFLL
jgi:hypothetical protein